MRAPREDQQPEVITRAPLECERQIYDQDIVKVWLRCTRRLSQVCLEPNSKRRASRWPQWSLWVLGTRTNTLAHALYVMLADCNSSQASKVLVIDSIYSRVCVGVGVFVFVFVCMCVINTSSQTKPLYYHTSIIVVFISPNLKINIIAISCS